MQIQMILTDVISKELCWEFLEANQSYAEYNFLD